MKANLSVIFIITDFNLVKELIQSWVHSLVTFNSSDLFLAFTHDCQLFHYSP